MHNIFTHTMKLCLAALLLLGAAILIKGLLPYLLEPTSTAEDTELIAQQWAVIAAQTDTIQALREARQRAVAAQMDTIQALHRAKQRIVDAAQKRFDKFVDRTRGLREAKQETVVVVREVVVAPQGEAVVTPQTSLDKHLDETQDLHKAVHRAGTGLHRRAGPPSPKHLQDMRHLHLTKHRADDEHHSHPQLHLH